ncbi:MAG: Peptidase like family [Candidatus Parcubacteria bacterium]|jgi:hypothetical protein
MKNLNIPFFSQLDPSIPAEHQRKVCALACTKMILDSKGESISFEHLFEEASIVGNYEKAGWSHETVVRLLRNHKVLAYKQEFLAHDISFEIQTGTVAKHTEQFLQFGIQKIKQSIDKGNPVILSVRAGFSDNNGDHMILVAGYKDENLIILDPILLQEQNPKLISIDELKKFWKNFAIFTE